MQESQTFQTPETVIKPIEKTPMVATKIAGIILVVTFVLGSATGFMVAQLTPTSTQGTGGSASEVQRVDTETKAGIIDKKTFTDTATGVLREGGIDGEGSHHLERGAKDQTAYLTSSTVDLSTYIGKKVQVWGQTNTAQKAGWLMDVGSVEVISE
ncbi:MAG TPA: hypothetical protein PKG71_04090 [Candidatus Woesebacteria bacterium]|nr:hypothetical protein [Candidatus Woesebacteria bacterium]HNS95119.1 hypothetical protein [Candidatus Woesebacteria bacterium]